MNVDKTHFIQLINKEDGTRSEPVACSLRQMADALENAPPEKECYVLVIGSADPEDDNDIGSWFSPFPLVGTEFFIRVIKELDVEEVSNG